MSDPTAGPSDLLLKPTDFQVLTNVATYFRPFGPRLLWSDMPLSKGISPMRNAQGDLSLNKFILDVVWISTSMEVKCDA